jgi:periplasmic protein TonB
MSAAAAIYPPDSLKKPLWYSVVLHLAVVSGVVISAYYAPRQETWGGPGGSVTVGLVGSVPAIPLPTPEEETPSRVVDESKGLYKSGPQSKSEPTATPIPQFQQKKPPKIISRPSRLLENTVPPPQNAIPYGQGGAPTIPVTSFALDAGNTQAGMSFNGTSTGDFGSRFPWYVQAVQQRISGNWLQSTIGPSVQYAPRVVVDFTILRDGTITNPQVVQSSNDYSVDTSAIRAVQNSSPLGRLPDGYSGSSVNVTFWFDYRR